MSHTTAVRYVRSVFENRARNGGALDANIIVGELMDAIMRRREESGIEVLIFRRMAVPSP
jgi:hypothetical protein